MVAFTTDWAEDAQRRDFRLNALYMDGEGSLYDPTGSGVPDALAGRIVFVGDASTRIREDYLRILRFFRFRAWFGRGAPDAEGLAACSALKSGLGGSRPSGCPRNCSSCWRPRTARSGERDGRGGGAGRNPARSRLAGALRRPGRDRADASGRGRRRPEAGGLAPLRPGRRGGGLAQRLRLSNAQRERIEAAAGRDPAISPAMTPATGPPGALRRRGARLPGPGRPGLGRAGRGRPGPGLRCCAWPGPGSVRSSP
ncbi:MAG: hypothetical protein WDN45_02910 [Caulobacteraceae bacterium]